MNRWLIGVVLLLVIGLFMGEAYALNAAVSQGYGNPDNWYIQVEWNNANVAARPTHGAVLEWELDSDTGETLGWTVHLVDADDCEYVAGVVPAYSDYAHNLDWTTRSSTGGLADGDVFLMQIRGYHAAIRPISPFIVFSSCFSITATFAPLSEAPRAARRPACPPPSTSTSTSIVLLISASGITGAVLSQSPSPQ